MFESGTTQTRASTAVTAALSRCHVGWVDPHRLSLIAADPSPRRHSPRGSMSLGSLSSIYRPIWLWGVGIRQCLGSCGPQPLTQVGGTASGQRTNATTASPSLVSSAQVDFKRGYGGGRHGSLPWSKHLHLQNTFEHALVGLGRFELPISRPPAERSRPN